MREQFITLNGVPTLVVTCGKSIDDRSADMKELILFFVGNPGVPGFYHKFIQNLYTSFNEEISVWCIGGAGHNYPPDSTCPDLKKNGDKYNLQGQVDHKIELFQKYIPATTKVYVIGHSLGSLITLNLLKFPDIKEKIEHCYLLFPVMERMGIAPRAPGFKRLFLEKFYLLKFLYTIFNMLPNGLRYFLILMYFKIMQYPDDFIAAVVSYLNPLILEKSVYLTKDVMDNYKTLDYQYVEKHKDIMKFYYGTRDGWCPVQYYEDLKENVPNVDAELDQLNMPHTFVFQRNNQMAQIIAGWIRKIR